MRVVGLIMRVYAFLFHILLTLFMMAVAAVAGLSGNESLQIGVLPWHGTALVYWMFFLGLAGLVVTLLAIRRILPLLFLLWALAVFIMLAKGYFFSSYNFGLGGGSITTALYLLGAALLALAGAWLQFRYKPAAVRRRNAFA